MHKYRMRDLEYWLQARTELGPDDGTVLWAERVLWIENQIWMATPSDNHTVCGLPYFVHEELGGCPYYNPESST